MKKIFGFSVRGEIFFFGTIYTVNNVFLFSFGPQSQVRKVNGAFWLVDEWSVSLDTDISPRFGPLAFRQNKPRSKDNFQTEKILKSSPYRY